MRRAFFIALVALAGCGEKGALVVVTVDAQPALSTAMLHGTATLGTRNKTFSLAVTGGAIPPQFVFGIELGANTSGTLDVSLTADGTTRTAHGTVPVVSGGRADLPLSFSDLGADLGIEDSGPSADQAMTPLDLFDSDTLPVTSRRYVVNHFTFPTQRLDFAYDLNGDGKLDNQYGNIEGAFISENFFAGDMVMISFDELAVNADVQSGNYLMLIEHQSTDPAFASDPYSRVLVRQAQPHINPAFDGTGAFVVDGTKPVSRFDGVLTGGQFSSRQVSTLPQPVTINVEIGGAGVVVPVTLTGAHIEYQLTVSGLMLGRIQGAMTRDTVDDVFIPNLAKGISANIAANPGTPNTVQLLAIFDTGDPLGVCDGIPPRDFAGLDLSTIPTTCFCALAGDNVIDNCEVSQNAIIRNILSPDVDLFDASNNWAPNAANTDKDSLSVAIAFTAVPATF